MGWRQVCTSGGDTLRRTWCLPPSRGERWLANTWGTPHSQHPALCRQATSYAWSTPTTEIQPPGSACGVARAVGLQSASSPKPTRVHAEMPSFHNAQKREPADHQGSPSRRRTHNGRDPTVQEPRWPIAHPLMPKNDHMHRTHIRLDAQPDCPPF